MHFCARPPNASGCMNERENRVMNYEGVSRNSIKTFRDFTEASLFDYFKQIGGQARRLE